MENTKFICAATPAHHHQITYTSPRLMHMNSLEDFMGLLMPSVVIKASPLFISTFSFY